jgi:hypothetical protein
MVGARGRPLAPRRVRRALALCIALGIAGAAGLPAGPVRAGDGVRLEGTVTGADQQPRRRVLVDVLGPRRVFTRTDDDGRFSVQLPVGVYTIRVRDGSRRQEFPLDVTAGQGGSISRVFTVRW